MGCKTCTLSQCGYKIANADNCRDDDVYAGKAFYLNMDVAVYVYVRGASMYKVYFAILNEQGYSNVIHFFLFRCCSVPSWLRLQRR